MTEETGKKQRGKQWPKGTSGNPSGRPPGSRNKSTLAAQVLLDGQSEALTNRAIELALSGDITALRLCLDRIISPRRDRPIELQLPGPLKTAADVAMATAKIAESMAAGEITPAEAQAAGAVLDLYRGALETANLELRIKELENKCNESQHSAGKTRRPFGRP